MTMGNWYFYTMWMLTLTNLFIPTIRPKVKALFPKESWSESGFLVLEDVVETTTKMGVYGSATDNQMLKSETIP